MKDFRIVFCIIATCFFISCGEDNCLWFMPCLDTPPEHGTVNIKATIDALNHVVPVDIYIGNIEDDHFYGTEFLSKEHTELTLPNGTYSIRAAYFAMVNGEKVSVFVVDGDTLSEGTGYGCSDPCYEEGSIDLDVSLISLKKK